ncbi:hypothetical protein CROQUDRAFT_55760 [Cronartium quercuum f. sp. fusiforme G11]|uniref:Calcofluor white hypersensitive protein n=1 Tax=Cronartium quercuum f. sp. fusiforme G11 TaxID=708437 RepID=A0A9P6NZN1_9BASI|nr:hypothetical protein CROQUDRAFT_55760 [Cronartium quercuum f. sp. fusiforme G11]
MSSKPQTQPLTTISASWISFFHTLFALGAFGGALITGLFLHFHKIVKNEWYGYPLEWFPSVSATIGDYYPERSLFHILIAFNSGPRLGLVYFSYLFQSHFATQSSALGPFVCLCGLLRTISCAGWVYVTSSEDHNLHDVMMISYLVLTIPWQWGSIYLSPSSTRLSGNKYRKRFSTLFFISIIPLVYFFIQHKIQRIPGAYTYYAFIEWSLILYDVLYDSCTILDFAHFDISINVRPKNELQLMSWTTAHRKLFQGQSEETLKTIPSIKNENHLLQRNSRCEARCDGFSSWLDPSHTRLFCADLYLGFVFWTTLTALGPTIFYFSVWSMGLDGMEVLLFVTLAPFLLCLPLLRTFLFKLVPLLRLLSLLSVGSYVIDGEPFYDDSVLRLQLTAASVGICTLLSVIDWSSGKALERKLAGFGLGLVASVLIKYANYSLNPMWPIMKNANGGYNRIGVILGLWANFELFLASRRDGKTSANTKGSQGESSNFNDEEGEDEEEDMAEVSSRWRWWGTSLGFGALIFLIHTLFTDSGTILAWVWDGYPITGPTTVKHGYLMIMAMCVGLFMRSSAPDGLPSHPLWYTLALISSFGLVYFHGWLGFSSGLLLCVFSLSQLDRFARNLLHASRPRGWSSIGLGFGLSYLLYDILELVHTFTVAYAFVPGGEYFREHTPLILTVVMGFIGLGFFQPRRNVERREAETDTQVRKTLAVLVMGAVIVMGWRTVWMTKDIVPYDVANRSFKAGIWTVHFGVDSGMWESQRRMRDIFAELQLDVVGLLESDLQRIVMGNRDLTQYIAEDLGMYVDLGPGPNKHTWGAALLSKFPIVNSTHHLLPSPKGELAPAIHATLDMFGTMVDVIVSHNGQEEDPLDRQLQSEELARIMREAFPRPLVFLGYVVSRPHAPRPAPYQILIESGRMLDIERADYDRWCEYIFFRGLRRVGYARVTRGSNPAVTDTEIQVGSFQVPPDWVTVDPERDLANYEHIPESSVKESMRFSSKLVDGFKGHTYHVLKEQFGTDVVYYKLW